jgi:hypothetical protein
MLVQAIRGLPHAGVRGMATFVPVVRLTLVAVPPPSSPKRR